MIDRSLMVNSYDNSRLKDYQACKARYDYKYNHGLADESGLAARYSTILIHDPIECWYKFKGNYEPNWGLLMKAWNPSQEELLADKFTSYTVEKASKLFKEYTTKFKDDLDVYEYVESEVYRTKELSSDLKPWGSKTDVVLRHRPTQEIHTLEIKASKWDYILVGLSFNAQVVGQAYVNKATRSLVAYFNLTNKPSVERFEFEFDEAEIESWRAERGLDILQMQLSEKFDIWPRNEKNCKAYNRVCPFLDLCDLGGMSNPMVREKVKNMPKIDPLEYLEGGE